MFELTPEMHRERIMRSIMKSADLSLEEAEKYFNQRSAASNQTSTVSAEWQEANVEEDTKPADEEIADDDDESAAYSPSAYLASGEVGPAEAIEFLDLQSDNNMRLQNAIEGLDERSQMILQKRWLDEKKLTLHELADQYGVSAERIRQLEKNAMACLKRQMQQ